MKFKVKFDKAFFGVYGTVSAGGVWYQAFETAVKHDRMSLRQVHFNYAQYLETTKQPSDAICTASAIQQSVVCVLPHDM